MGYRKERKRAAVSIEGRVQGVGFRPFVYRNALKNRLSGFVCNTPQGVYIEAQGDSADIKEFLDTLKYHSPEHSAISYLSVFYITPLKEKGFRIEQSFVNPVPVENRTEISPDIAVCKECLEELFAPDDRRHLFPFINCTNCGPRFSITRKLPYDRENTSMYRFLMCPDCYAEYVNPLDRRFHAQPDCCFACGPEYSLFDGKGKKGNAGFDAVKEAASLIEKGHIVAVKGIGGYHLVCEAGNRDAVKTLRVRKRRGDKPFALMARDMKTVSSFCTVNMQEKKLLASWRAPVVILRKKETCRLPEEIAPRNKYLGFFLPYAPVHHMLFYCGRFSTIVATSANIADEPIIYKDSEALEKLPVIADYILSHNREIVTGCDDSVARIERFDKKIHMVRRARGYIPEPFKTPFLFKEPVFAAGANEKNSFSMGTGSSIITSQYTGNLDNMASFGFYRDTYEHFRKVFNFAPMVIAHDLHPDYASTRFAKELSAKECIPAIGVQHHHAHIASCMADNGLPQQKVIGVALDGTGYGEEGDIRGCEFMVADYAGFERMAWLEYIPLPGGDAAVKETWRTGLSYLFGAFGDKFAGTDVPLLSGIEGSKMRFVKEMLCRNINCPGASSMGRLFDGIAAILGLRYEISYDAQAAVELEMAAGKISAAPYMFGLKPAAGKKGIVIDPFPVIRQVVEDLERGKNCGFISGRFHSGIAAMVTAICKRIKEERNISAAVLSGGVFQNSFLLNETCESLSENGFKVYRHGRLPSNDGSISAGQAAVACFTRQ